MAEQAMLIAEKLKATLLLPGNIYNFGSKMPAVLTEATPQHADTRKGMLRVQLEHTLAQRCEQGRLRAVVLRAGDFYGAGSGNWFDMAITKDLRKGKLVYPGPMNLPHAWAYLPDLTDTAALLMQSAIHQAHRFTPFEVFHFEGHTLTGQAMYEMMANLQLHPQGKPLKLGSLPWGLMRIGSRFVPIWRELLEMRYLWDVPHRLDDSKLKSLIDVVPRTDMAQAMRHAIK
jgi:nucleoside-diphosphate-sugar epimerase